ncbi:TPR-like protein [Gonapodya prolifera JEL478]|uniref:TPR-like protein n=1 Tax=Gonapodya prolifera (strain JEL478) TaxID=1344416 RepID=A0A139A5N6_GONPJ|nr:TPR-like protein [Gonapodya prolifera JEL478]|eukprot:KXS12051.1 TPR-like protein [Gonapodya prolifera JEL478]
MLCKDLAWFISRRVAWFLFHDDSPIERATQLLFLANASLCLFVQNAWTGPSVSLDISVIVPHAEKIVKNAALWLSADGEDVYHLTPQLYLLWIARLIYRSIREHEEIELQTLSWWNLRSLLFQQRILENPAATLMEEIERESVSIWKCLEAYQTDSSDGVFSSLATRHYLECGIAHHLHRRDRMAQGAFEDAQRSSGFFWQLTGALGRRTKFQQTDVSQLVISAKSQTGNGVEDPTKQKFPENLKLNDDTLLDTIELTNATVGDDTNRPLNVADQVILLSFCLNVKNTNPKDGLTNEEMGPFVRRVLDQPANWSVYTMALLLRSRLESEKSRTVERAALQLQALVDQFDVDEGPPAERMMWIWALDLPPKWQLERELADRFMSIGVTASALEIYTRLEMWEQCVDCLRLLDKTAKAESLLRQLINKDPEIPKYWCLLGDLTKEEAMYEKSWALSGKRYSRAMRSLGSLHFRNKNYSKSVECYEAALAINPLFEDTWFMLGCAAMQISDWESAVRAFAKVTNMNWENGEAWNNLASVYLQLKKKPEAHRALQQALKINFDSWKVWQNYLYVSVDIGDFEEAVRSTSRLLELRAHSAGSEAVDLEVLDIILKAVNSGTRDVEGRSARHLAEQVSELLVKITDQVAENARLWTLASAFWEWNGQFTLALEARLKAYRAVSKNPEIAYSKEAFEEFVSVTLELVDAYERIGAKTISEQSSSGDPVTRIVCEDWKYQAKMVLRTVIGRTAKSWDSTELYEQLRNRLQSL